MSQRAFWQAAKLSSPAPKVYLERPPAPFWNENCRLAIKERNQKRNIFRRNRTEESFENYKRAKCPVGSQECQKGMLAKFLL